MISSGNVGIGTWEPTATLDVRNRLSAGFFLKLIDSNDNTNLSAQSTKFIFYNSASVAGSTIYSFSGLMPTNGGSYFDINPSSGGNNTSDVFNVRKSGTPYFVVKESGGNVGIGTTAPASRLSIVGGVGIGTGFNSLYVSTAAPTGGLIIESNVGIGSLAPGTALDVNGTVRASAFSGDGSALTNISAGGWTDGGTTVYNTTGSDNVGIGTTTPQGGFVVTNGNVGIGTWAPNSLFNVKGSLSAVVVSKSSSYTATASDYMILVSGNTTITLPAAAGVNGRMYVIKKTDSSATILTVAANGAETIDGFNTISTTTQYQAYTIVCDGSGWWII